MAKTLIYAAGSPTSVKIGDTDTDLYLQVAKDNAAVDLTAVKSITVKIADASRNYLKDISIDLSSLADTNQGILVVPLNSNNVNGLNSGDYYFEVWIVTADGDSEIYPDMNVTKFHVFNNIVGGTTVFTTLTLQQFANSITDMEDDLQSKVNSGYFKGDKGNTGVGVSSSAVTYQLSSSGTTTPTGAWSSSVLAQTTDTPYLWVRTVITYTDSTSTTMYSVSKKGDTGTVDNTGLTNAPAFQALQTQVNNSAVGTNLLMGTSGTLQTVTNASGWHYHTPSYSSTVATVDSDTSYTARVWIAPASYDMMVQLAWEDASGNYHYDSGNIISAGTSGYSTRTSVITAGSTIQYVSIVFTASQSTASSVSYKEAKLEKGSHASNWSPNPSEILTQTDYAKIKAAIVALGGSLS